LQHVERYPFVKQESTEGSKRKLYTLDSDSEYSTAIREFFRTERRRERRDGTVPVDVWNLLEEVTNTLDGKVDSFLELVLFGSYARGDYHAGSDLDLLLVYTDPEEDVKIIADHVIESLDADKEIQLLTAIVEKPAVQRVSNSGLDGEIRKKAPVAETEPLIALSGSVEL
jgi:predicted nucleotidyltransferase